MCGWVNTIRRNNDQDNMIAGVALKSSLVPWNRHGLSIEFVISCIRWRSSTHQLHVYTSNIAYLQWDPSRNHIRYWSIGPASACNTRDLPVKRSLCAVGWEFSALDSKRTGKSNDSSCPCIVRDQMMPLEFVVHLSWIQPRLHFPPHVLRLGCIIAIEEFASNWKIHFISLSSDSFV